MLEEMFGLWVILWSLVFAFLFLGLDNAQNKKSQTAAKWLKATVAWLLAFCGSIMFYGGLKYGWFEWFNK